VLFRQVLHEDLGCASYVVADAREAAVIDPKWEIEDYLALAEEHRFQIGRILETHNHADHVSGRGRLAAVTGASIHVSREAGVEYPHEPLSDGDAVEVGSARIVALATPGHRPEHMAFLVTDTSRSDSPWLLLTGDSLFVGDIARPDLAVDAEEGARGIYRSLRRLLELDDFVEVWPGHIGGSLCGGAGMSKKPSSTVGFERRFNPFLQIASEADFVRELTDALEPQPPNFERIVELNRGPLVTEPAPLEPLTPARVHQLLEVGAELVDGREPREYDSAHVPGSINVTMVRAAVGTRAAWVVDPESAVVVVGPADADARRLGSVLEPVGSATSAGSSRAGSRPGRTQGCSSRRRMRSTFPSSRRACARGRSTCSTCGTPTSGRRDTSRARSTSRTTSCATASRMGSVPEAARSRSSARWAIGARSPRPCSGARRRRPGPRRRRRRP
jgi:hydroxyacylglutathione hydrolase